METVQISAFFREQVSVTRALVELAWLMPVEERLKSSNWLLGTDFWTWSVEAQRELAVFIIQNFFDFKNYSLPS